MNSKKAYFVMLGCVTLTSLLVIGAVVASDLFLKKQSDKLLNLKLDSLVIEAQQTALVQAKKDVEKYAELESISKQVVPQDKDQARAVRELVQIAAQSGVKISQISFPSSSLGQKSTITTPSTDAASTPAPAVNPLTQAKPVSGIEGLYELTIDIDSEPLQPVSYNSLINFLELLEHNRRTAQVSKISIQPADNRTNLTFSLTILVYIKP